MDVALAVHAVVVAGAVGRVDHRVVALQAVGRPALAVVNLVLSGAGFRDFAGECDSRPNLRR
jgi:hypothetical protein